MTTLIFDGLKLSKGENTGEHGEKRIKNFHGKGSRIRFPCHNTYAYTCRETAFHFSKKCCFVEFGKLLSIPLSNSFKTIFVDRNIAKGKYLSMYCRYSL